MPVPFYLRAYLWVVSLFRVDDFSLPQPVLAEGQGTHGGRRDFFSFLSVLGGLCGEKLAGVPINTIGETTSLRRRVVSLYRPLRNRKR